MPLRSPADAISGYRGRVSTVIVWTDTEYLSPVPAPRGSRRRSSFCAPTSRRLRTPDARQATRIGYLASVCEGRSDGSGEVTGDTPPIAELCRVGNRARRPRPAQRSCFGARARQSVRLPAATDRRLAWARRGASSWPWWSAVCVVGLSPSVDWYRFHTLARWNLWVRLAAMSRSAATSPVGCCPGRGKPPRCRSGSPSPG